MAGIFRRSLGSSDDFDIHYKGRRNYGISIQDFTPFIGSHIYAIRNMKRTGGSPVPYENFLRTGDYLTILNSATGTTAVGAMIAGLYKAFF